MNEVRVASPDPLTSAIAPLLEKLWSSYQQGDLVTHSALLTPDYRSVHPDGSIHQHPTPEDIDKTPIAGYTLSEVQAWPVGELRERESNEEAALVSYVAEIAIPVPPALKVKFVVGEIWQRHKGEWKRRYNQSTLTK